MLLLLHVAVAVAIDVAIDVAAFVDLSFTICDFSQSILALF